MRVHRFQTLSIFDLPRGRVAGRRRPPGARQAYGLWLMAYSSWLIAYGLRRRLAQIAGAAAVSGEAWAGAARRRCQTLAARALGRSCS